MFLYGTEQMSGMNLILVMKYLFIMNHKKNQKKKELIYFIINIYDIKKR